MLIGISIAVMALGSVLFLFGFVGPTLRIVGRFLHAFLGEFAQGISFVLGFVMLTGGLWIYPTKTVDRSLIAQEKLLEKNEMTHANAGKEPVAKEQEPSKPTALVSTQPGTIFRDCPECPEMIVLPTGVATLGAPETDPERTSHELPPHKAAISYVLAVGRFEITFAEWDACATAGGCRKDVQQPSWGRYGQHPVVNVDWRDTQVYLDWLKKTSGFEYRLLTETEWEYAARANRPTRYSWGNEIGQNYANCSNCSSSSKEQATRSTGAFIGNAFSLFDMHGNVHEWVIDCWHNNYQGAPNDGSAWLHQCDEGRRVLKGGAWNTPAQDLRTSARHRETWDKRAENIGFRVARILPESKTP